MNNSSAKTDGRAGKRDDWVRSCAICPYYKRENRSKIVCSGVDEIASLHATFAEPSKKKKYEHQYCDKDWQECCIARLLEASEE